MRIGNRTLGAMTLVNAESGRALEGSDVELAEQIAARAAVAIENARVYSERSSIAHTLQQSLLPEQLPEIPGYELAGVYLPALEGTQVGGDFYDVWETREGWMVAMGDVAGKGVEAAALTSLIRHTLRATAEFVSSPAELLARLDLTLKKQRVRSICTALCLRLEEEQITLAIGGHPLPIWITADGAQEVGKYGSLLGAFVSVEWQDMALEFAPQSTLVMYTDGVTDALGSQGERYGARRLRATLDQCRRLSASEVVQTLTSALGDFQVGEHADDTAVLALRRVAPEPLARSSEAGEVGRTHALSKVA
jgi:serine phosphatase RsbU (regulator of sigma subunit)